MSIPKYPETKPLEWTDKTVVETALRAVPPTVSELTFTNLYTWRGHYGTHVTVFDGTVLLSVGNAPSEKKFFPPLTEPAAAARIMEYIADTSGAVFIRVPGNVKDEIKGLRAAHDPDNDDYVYNTEDLAELTGKKYDGKRNLISKFNRDNEHDYVVIRANNAEECLYFEDTWCDIKHCDEVEGLRNERAALEEMIRHFAELDLVAGGIRTDGGIKAIAIGQPLNADTMVLHILKADPAVPGLYQVMNNEFVRNACGGYKYVNMEQDLGVPGLRKAKQSYHPVYMVRKYTVRV